MGLDCRGEVGRKRGLHLVPRLIGDGRYRVEKYRPNSLDDVTGHEDILNTSEFLPTTAWVWCGGRLTEWMGWMLTNGMCL